MFEILKDYWGQIVAFIMVIGWSSRLEYRVTQIEKDDEEDPPMRESMCALRHSSSRELDEARVKAAKELEAARIASFTHQIATLSEQIKSNDKNVRDMIDKVDQNGKERYEHLIQVLKSRP